MGHGVSLQVLEALEGGWRGEQAQHILPSEPVSGLLLGPQEKGTTQFNLALAQKGPPRLEYHIRAFSGSQGPSPEAEIG